MTSPLRILSYNILDGGLGRLDPIYETLLYLNADVTGLCEADDGAGVEYLARKLACDYVVAESLNSRHHVALLSRLPIERMANLGVRIGALSKAAMEAVVRVGDQPLRLVLLHLPHGQREGDEARRLAELDAILDAISDEALPTVLMGDFNAAAPYHPFDRAAAMPRTIQELQDRSADDLDHDLVNRLTGAGWVDVYHRFHPGDPRHTFTTGFPATRFDYIFLDPALAGRALDADVETGGFAPYCSDHYPIWADLRR